MPDSQLPPTKADLRAVLDSNAALKKSIDTQNKILEPLIDGFKDLKSSTRNNKILGVILLFAVIALGWQIWQNENTAKIACENANESRQVQRQLWNGIAAAPQEEPRSATELANVAALLMYIEEAFADRDCDDLDRKYPAPEFPKLKAERD